MIVLIEPCVASSRIYDTLLLFCMGFYIREVNAYRTVCPDFVIMRVALLVRADCLISSYCIRNFGTWA